MLFSSVSFGFFWFFCTFFFVLIVFVCWLSYLIVFVYIAQLHMFVRCRQVAEITCPPALPMDSLHFLFYQEKEILVYFMDFIPHSVGYAVIVIV